MTKIKHLHHPKRREETLGHECTMVIDKVTVSGEVVLVTPRRPATAQTPATTDSALSLSLCSGTL